MSTFDLRPGKQCSYLPPSLFLMKLRQNVNTWEEEKSKWAMLFTESSFKELNELSGASHIDCAQADSLFPSRKQQE